jgi:hypothetical protein
MSRGPLGAPKAAQTGTDMMDQVVLSDKPLLEANRRRDASFK